MSDVRQRRRAVGSGVAGKGGGKQRKGDRNNNPSLSDNSGSPSTLDDGMALGKFAYTVVGLGVLAYSCSWYSGYMYDLHENQLWFSSIREVEREISLRTECGLYYSYYKQLVNSTSFSDGISQLMRDNITEHGRSINILERFNIYQEVFLAGLHRGLGLSEKPIFFYVYSCFRLTGLFLGVVYCLAWYMTGTWVAGAVTAVYFAVNLDDATRAFFTVNLRETFAFPFLWLQILFVCIHLHRDPRRWKSTVSLCRLGILLFTFLFSLMWQFNQFVLLIQAVSLYGVALLQIAPVRKVQEILFLQGLGLLGVWVMQFAQPMILGSMVLSFIPTAILTLHLFRDVKQSGGIVMGGCKVVGQGLITVLAALILNKVLGLLLHLEADEHIYKFLKGKFGLQDPRDFEARIYLCHGAFVFLDNGFFWRTSTTFLFPPYMMVMCGTLFLIGKDLLTEWCASIMPNAPRHKQMDPGDLSDKAYFFCRRPNLAYLVIQSCVSGLVAMMTLRMKYLWFPHLAILAAFGFCDKELWTLLLSLGKIGSKWGVECVRHAVPVLVGGLLIWRFIPVYQQQMTDLKEFYDPDTVELMEWINNQTQPEDSLAGSMQLLAGVKACTSRHLTNHPHFEDKWLRERTKQVYQIYARKHPKEVHDILTSIGTHYIILEDSICLARADGCRTPDLMDLENGHVPDNGFMQDQLKRSDTPRFCDEIRHMTTQYNRRFKEVLINKTFRVYKLI